MHKLNISYGQYPLAFLNILIIIYSLGIYIAEFITLPYKYLFLLLIVNFLSAFYLAQKKSNYTAFSVVILFFIIGILQGKFAFTISDNNISHYENQTITAVGSVSESPIIKQDKFNIYHITYIVDTKNIILKQGNQNKLLNVSGKIYLYKRYKDIKDLNKLAKINDTIQFTGNLRLINSYHNPGLINRELIAKQQEIYASLSVNKTDITIIKSDNSFSLKRFCHDIKEKIMDSLKKAMPKDDANLIFSMLFGGYNDISPELLEAFSATGIIHILSVSGSHISIIAGFILNICKLLKLPRILNMLILIVCITFYVILCGCSAPVVRAAIMGLLAVIALTLNKLYESRHILSISALVMLLIQPLLIFNISFQLSFISTAGLIYIMPYLKEKLSFLPKSFNFFIDNISLTLSAQLAVLPLMAWYFNNVSLSSLLANLIAVPPLEFIIILTLIGSLIGCMLPFFAFIQHIIFIIASLFLGYASTLTLLFAKMPFSSVYLPTMPIYLIVLYYFCWYALLNKKIFLSIKYFINNHKKHVFLIISVTIFSLFIFNNQFFTSKELQIHFIDVGQGDAALIITPNSKSVMIDTGGTANSDFDIGTRIDIPYLKHYGITKLDYLILSHSDADHAAGGASILQKIPVNHLIIANEGKEAYAKILKLPLNDPILQKSIIATENTQFLIDGIEFKFLHAGSQNTVKNNSSNEVSNVIKLTYHHFSVLFTGDLPTSGENDMLTKLSPNTLKSTILKVSHHGSNTSSSKEFLQTVKPQFAVISVGKYNNFGHPSSEVLERLGELPTKILRTDENGAIVFSTDGTKLYLQTFK